MVDIVMVMGVVVKMMAVDVLRLSVHIVYMK